MLYFDTSYLVRLYTRDFGWENVRALAATDFIGCSILGKAEVVSAFHRKFREGILTQKEFNQLNSEFENDCKKEAFQWLPLSASVLERAIKVYRLLPRITHLRASDALHLASAAESAPSAIYSNDTRLLEASAYFGLKGLNVILP